MDDYVQSKFPKKFGQKKGRMQFVAWLVYELNKRGESLNSSPNYADLMLATRRQFIDREKQ